MYQPAAVEKTSEQPRSERWKSFTVLFLIEMWERFGYYGMTAVVVLYMVKRLGYTDDQANLTFGAFVAMAYASPAVGGWLGDKVLGTRRMTVIGATILALGYTLLATPGSPLFLSLGVIAVGSGLFKPNPANLVSKVYEGDQARIDSAFTLYYMAVNVGSTLSQIATPLIAERVSWHLAFGVCAAGLVLGIVNYFVMGRLLRHVGSPPDFQPFPWTKFGLTLLGCLAAVGFVSFVVQNLAVAKAMVWLATLVMLSIFAMLISRGTRRERSGLIAVLILTAQGIIFFIFYQQMSTSLTLFADRSVHLDFLFGYHVPAGQVQALNPIWIFILSPPLAWLYTAMGKRSGGDLPVAVKFALGFVVLAIGFFVFAGSGYTAGPDGKVSLWWMILGYGLMSLGELLISGLGLAMVARYVGPKLRGFLMGTWFLATGISQYLGSYVATFASVPKDVTDPHQMLALYMRLYFGLGGV
ncbi:MAG TPA: oligopeptide:H+ symporter, partial [Myxococcaceae bacterium]|nr:oligopeptide:H+ symporter [Myxococcaceae bacterium]